MIAEPPAATEHDVLLETWVRGWAVSRELGAPEADGEGWRVDVGWPQQLRRHVFARPCETLRSLGAAIDEPWVFLKCCTTPEHLRELLPARWTVQARSAFMRHEGTPPVAPPLPAGYGLEVSGTAAVPHVSVLADDGSQAADGRVAFAGDTAIFDRIGTHAAHRRRGLGRAVMCALHGIAQARGARQALLVATQEGEALYRTLGWRVMEPYASAVILGDEAA